MLSVKKKHKLLFTFYIESHLKQCLFELAFVIVMNQS